MQTGTLSANETQRSTLGWQAPHWLYFVFIFLALGLYVAGGIAQTRVGAPSSTVEIGDDAWPLLVDGHEISGPDELRARIAGEAPGATVTARDRRGRAIEIEVRQAFTPFHDLVTRLNGLFFLAVSLVVFAPRVDVIPARDLFWACLLYGLAVMIGGVYAPHDPRGPWMALPLLRIVSLAVLPILMLHVGLTFPHRVGLLDRYRWLMPAIVLLGLSIAAWHYFTWARWLVGAGTWEQIDLPRRLAGLFLAATFGAGCAGLVVGNRKTDSERQREQVKWVLWGIAMGGAPFVFLHALPQALGGEAILPLAGARLFSIVIPLAFSMAVIRHRFLDVDIIIRRSLIYVTLASLMVGIYAVIGIFVGHRVQETWPATEPFVPIVATLVAALLFAPTRRGIALLIDRLFFNIRYTHTQALGGFIRELRGMTGQRQAADLLRRFLEENLDPDRIAVALVHDDEVFVAGPWPAGVSPMAPIRGDGLAVAVPGTTARAQIEAEDFPRILRGAGFVLAHTVGGEGHRVGMVALAEKRSGRSFIGEDLDLLASVARETSLRVQRMNLEQDFVDEVVARRRSEEMSRFRTQFFAQFAHDLRSPLTSINWAARNLLDGVVGEVSETQRGYLEGIESSARQLVRLVNNLLEATRLESGVPEVEFEDLAVGPVFEESASKLRATAATRDVRLELRLDPAPPIRGNGEKLLEIADNLLENAIRYAPPGTQVRVSVAGGDGRARVTVEDEGPGIDPADLETIFEPYRQGKASPHSPQIGFGLGLFVVRSWVERMGGSVSAENRNGGGARFVVDLPVAESVQEDDR